MNFFEAQARSRSKTGRLIVLFLAGVVGLLVSVNLLALVFIASQSNETQTRGVHPDELWMLPLLVTGVTLVFILVGTIHRLAQLAAGGRGVAQMLGAKLISRETKDQSERRLINVVDEMSIASGIPPPEVYAINEPSINAMAAGFEPSSAVIIVHRGTLDSLTRDELQSVIAHEFSHIFNGDMRLNVRIICAISGILSIVTLGRLLTRARSEGSRGGSGIALLGIALMLVGAVGAFFGRLIQAAVSRQREFLADATAVQYTRNPDSLVSCLRKILTSNSGSSSSTAAANDVSHMFFCALSSSSFGWLQTHPPLEERIGAINPRAGPTPSHGPSYSSSPLQSIGNPTEQDLATAQALTQQFSPSIVKASHTPRDAEALLLATVARPKTADQDQSASPLSREVSALGDGSRLAVISLASASLRELDEHSKLAVLQRLKTLIEADGKYSIFEVAVLIIVERALMSERVSVLHGARQAKSLSLAQAILPISRVLWAIALSGAPGPQEGPLRGIAFRRGAIPLFGETAIPPPQSLDADFRSLLEDLKQLDGLDFTSRSKLLEACWSCARSDQRLSLGEIETLRALHCALDCPMPPIRPEIHPSQRQA